MFRFLTGGALAAFLSVSALATEFETLICNKAADMDLSLSVQGDALKVKWTDMNDGSYPLLREVASAKISDETLQAYRHVKMEFSVPLSLCDFSDSAPGGFSCELTPSLGEPLDIRFEVKVSVYDVGNPRVFTGKLNALKFSTDFQKRKSTGTLVFPLEATVVKTKSSVSTKTTFFFTEDWNYDGISQRPSCKLNGKPLYH